MLLAFQNFKCGYDKSPVFHPHTCNRAESVSVESLGNDDEAKIDYLEVKCVKMRFKNVFLRMSK